MTDAPLCFVTTFTMTFLGDANLNAQVRVLSPLQIVAPAYSVLLAYTTKEREQRTTRIDGDAFDTLLQTLSTIHQYTALLATNDNSELFLNISTNTALFVKQKSALLGGTKNFVSVVFSDFAIEKELNQQIINTSGALKERIEQSKRYVAQKVQWYLNATPQA